MFFIGESSINSTRKITKKNYQVKYGTKITTYAQTRLNTIIKDTVYRNRQWKLLSDWGLLTKIGIKRAESILTIQGGLKDNKLQECLLAWQCYLDNYQTCGIRKIKYYQSQIRHIYS